MSSPSPLLNQQNSLVEYGSRRVIITITAIICALLEIVDTTIVNVAINPMKGNMGATLNEIAWVITAYAIGNVIIVPMTSWLSMQFGRRNYFAASIMIFTVCSFLCGNATSVWELVMFRFIQGVGGGALLVTSQTIITESYPPEKRSMAQAIYGLGVIVGPTLGPPLGGYIVEHYSWPYIFYINIPIGIIATLLTIKFVRSPVYGIKKTAREVDWLGIALLIGAVGSLQYVLEKGQEDDWFNSLTILGLSITSLFSFYFFIWRQLVVKNPVVELRVLSNNNLKVGTILSFVLGFGLYGTTFIIPLYTQANLGWTAQQAGMLLIPASLTTAFLMPVMGKILSKGVATQYLVSFGMFLFGVFCFWGYKIITPNTGKDDFFWMLEMRGFAMPFVFIPITALSLSSLKGIQIGQGAAFTGMMRQLGGSFGIAIITTIMSRNTVKHAADISSHLQATDPNVQLRLKGIEHLFFSRGNSFNIAEIKGLNLMELNVLRQASVISYMDVFQFVGIIFFVCVPFVLITKQRKKVAAQKLDLSAAH